MSVRSWFGATMLAAVTVLAGTQAASAHGEHGSHERHGTRITTTQAGADVFPPSIGVRAYLHDVNDGSPLADKRVDFTTPGGAEICRAYTNAEGEAACTGPLRLGTSSVGTLTNGYVATFRGDDHYTSSHAFGTAGILVRP
ncbi:hypothetical protein ACFY1P_10650 [Streptomyces sp. NPDC001407]|uniref:hypothetical protein n=1 Tax=unclassified Streptomyces TaxID=2593676 RepID=UPI0033F4862C